MIEAKSKCNITDADMLKFNRDVRDGDAHVFIFIRQGGVGNSRLLADRADFEVIDGKAVFFYKGDEHQLVDNLPVMFRYGAQLAEASCDLNALDQRMERATKRMRHARAILTADAMAAADV